MQYYIEMTRNNLCIISIFLIVGVHIDTGKKYEDTLLATLRIDEILVNKSEYPVLDVDGRSGCVSVMVIRVVEFSNGGNKIRKIFA